MESARQPLDAFAELRSAPRLPATDPFIANSARGPIYGGVGVDSLHSRHGATFVAQPSTVARLPQSGSTRL